MPRPPKPLTSGQIARQLRAQRGALQPTARSLGVASETLRAALHQHGLDHLPQLIRQEQRGVTQQETMEALIASGGIPTRTARALGIALSSLTARLRVLGLVDFARQLRPRPLTTSEERQQLLDSIVRNDGRLVAVAAELGISKGTLRARLKKQDLEREAEARRIDANLIGPRPRLGKTWNAAERRRKLVAILRSTGWNVRRASRIAGVSIGTMYNRMRDLRIDWRKEAAEDRFHRLVDALRVGDGVLARAGRHLAVGERTVRQWCREFDVEPREFRRGASWPATKYRTSDVQ